MESAVDLLELLRRLEGEECACINWSSPCECEERRREGKCRHLLPWHPPCVHILSSDHDLTPDEWLTLCCAALGRRSANGEDFADRSPASPAMVLSREARVAVMASRFARGEHLWHPGDLCQEGDEDVAVQVHRLVTCGAIVEDGLVSRRVA